MLVVIASGRHLRFRLEGSKVIDRCGRVFGVAGGGVHLQNLAGCSALNCLWG